jgi:hypothetical protein
MIMKNQKEGVVMKKLLAVLCFVPVGFCLVAFAYELYIDTPTMLNRFIAVALVVITYELVKFGINKIHALGARQRRGR